MSGFQPNPYPTSNIDSPQWTNDEARENWGDSAITDCKDEEHEPMSLGEKVGLVFLVINSAVISIGGLHWLLA